MRNNQAPDGIVTRGEFEEYYNNVSASIDRDDYFAQMMTSAWNLDNSRVTKQAWGNSAPQQKGAAQKPATSQPSTPVQSRPSTAQSQRGGQRPAQSQQDIFGNSRAAKQTPAEDLYSGGKVMTDNQICEKMTKALALRGARGI